MFSGPGTERSCPPLRILSGRIFLNQIVQSDWNHDGRSDLAVSHDGVLSTPLNKPLAAAIERCAANGPFSCAFLWNARAGQECNRLRAGFAQMDHYLACLAIVGNALDLAFWRIRAVNPCSGKHRLCGWQRFSRAAFPAGHLGSAAGYMKTHILHRARASIFWCRSRTRSTHLVLRQFEIVVQRARPERLRQPREREHMNSKIPHREPQGRFRCEKPAQPKRSLLFG